ncbi:MAG TPA: prepilin-type N-terminal cleavage/methylation domain-containing protein [Opitutus sp.]|nr:prepilin-type N-terminal cleavage/methylation domain-containing protein [Opitutus sp.]
MPLRRKIGSSVQSPGIAVAGFRARAKTAAGFTLIELLTVIAIIALVGSIVIGVGRRASEAGKVARAKAELAAISAGLEGYRRQYGDYPQTDDEAILLQSLLGKLGPTQAALSGRAQIDTTLFKAGDDADLNSAPNAILTDPWGQPYVYAYKFPAAGWTNPSFVLYSTGPDREDDPALLSGGRPNPEAPVNADNIYTNQ